MNSSGHRQHQPYVEFVQEAPRLGNQYDDDPFLGETLRRYFAIEDRPFDDQDLRRFGARVVGDILQLSENAENPDNAPRLRQFDAWGHRVDIVETSEGWRQLHRVAAEEGLVALGYTEGRSRFGKLARLYQFTKLYLFGPDSGIYSCPLAMTDGATRLTELFIRGLEHQPDTSSAEGKQQKLELLREMFSRFTTRDADRFWTSGQWMSEKTGGSDVGRTETIASKRSMTAAPTSGQLSHQGEYYLNGTKSFTSAIDCTVAMVLARIVDNPNDRSGGKDGSAGLSLFLVRLRDANNGRLAAGIQIHKLKEKLGTRALPTAELTLHDTKAILLGDQGRGVATIVTLVNVTRIYNSISAIAFARRSLEIAKDFSRRREAFGKLLVHHPLHVHTLAKLEVEVRGCVAMTLDITYLMGCAETGGANASQHLLLRLLTPVVKLYTGKRAVTVTSEALEVLGGTGYMEDSGMPRLLRNAQVLPIWEGTTNVLSLDVLRVLRKQPQALVAFMKEVQQIFSRRASSSEISSVLAPCSQVILNRELPAIQQYAIKMNQMEPEFAETGAREFAFRLGYLYGAKCLFEHALWSDETAQVSKKQALCNAHVVSDWIMQAATFDSSNGSTSSGFLGLAHCDEKRRGIDHLIVMGATDMPLRSRI